MPHPLWGGRVADLARRQGGAIETGQLRGMGMDKHRLRRLVVAGWLARVHHGAILGALS